MKNKQKKFLAKTSIIICLIFMILFLIFIIGSEIGLFGKYNVFCCYFGYKVFGSLYLASGIIMIILICKINIESKKFKKYKIKYENYKEFQDKLYDKLYNDGYSDFKEFKTNNYVINYAIKKSYFDDYVFVLIHLKEMNETILNEFEKKHFKDFEVYLIENKKLNPNKNINIFYIINVDKLNKYFKRYIERAVYQYYKKYNFPVGLSFSTGKLYIPSQIEDFAVLRYKKLKSKFKRYIKDLIVNDK